MDNPNSGALAELGKIATVAGGACVRACWSQWVALGSLAAPAGDRRPSSIVDPEALVLLSIYMHPQERRLLDLVGWWAATASGLLSVHRFRSVARKFPRPFGDEATGLFARMAFEAGDRRWRRYADGEVLQSARTGKGPSELVFVEPSTLWLRLRAGFGVGAKADVLAFLLGLRGAWASAKVISLATGYSSVTVRKALKEMVLARLIRETDERPSEYFAPEKPWVELLELYPLQNQGPGRHENPRWRFWADIFAFLAHVQEWRHRSEASDDVSQRVIASWGRDLLEDHRLAFQLNAIPVPSLSDLRGPDLVPGLRQTVHVTVEWMEKNL